MVPPTRIDEDGRYEQSSLDVFGHCRSGMGRLHGGPGEASRQRSSSGYRYAYCCNDRGPRSHGAGAVRDPRVRGTDGRSAASA
jgi:hypothetical protein